MSGKECRCDELEPKLIEAQRKIEDQAKALKDMQRKIDDAIQTAQQTILTDKDLRQGDNLPRGVWAYSKASATASLSVIEKLGTGGSVYSPATRRRRPQARRKKIDGFSGYLMRVLR